MRRGCCVRLPWVHSTTAVFVRRVSPRRARDTLRRRRALLVGPDGSVPVRSPLAVLVLLRCVDAKSAPCTTGRSNAHAHTTHA
eukprot:6064622-Prymnesium_polylepis.1